MSEEAQLMEVFIDLLPNQPKNDQTRENLRLLLRQKFEERLPDAIERIWEQPPVMLKARGECLALLLEARELYIAGHSYSCVAMCGIVGEHLVKDVLRAYVLVRKGISAQPPPEVAFDQLERIEVNGIVRFLKEADLLSDDATKAADSLGQLRNQYAHARGKNPQPDALNSIKLLHTLVEGTVSVLKDFDIKNGVLVVKGSAMKDEP